jgi:hypothetical protein
MTEVAKEREERNQAFLKRMEVYLSQKMKEEKSQVLEQLYMDVKELQHRAARIGNSL